MVAMPSKRLRVHPFFADDVSAEDIATAPKLTVELDGGHAFVDDEGMWYAYDRDILEAVHTASMKINHSGHWPEHMGKAAWAARAVIRLLGRGRLIDSPPPPEPDQDPIPPDTDF